MEESDHYVQFYESGEFLLESLRDYVGSGLKEAETAVVIATESRCHELERRLRGDGLDVDTAKSKGRFVTLDAQATLDKFMVNGTPDADLFNEVIGGVITRAEQNGAGIRAFGEMVWLLWEQENFDAAIRLEELWNELQSTHRFKLLCAYPVQGFASSRFSERLRHVCDRHGGVIPAESYTQLNEPQDQLRAIALLQQKAESLQSEIADRQQAQERLRLSELRYRRLFETSRDGLLILNKATGKIADINSRLAELLGLEPDEILGMGLWEVGLLPDAETNQQVWLELEAQGEVRFEHLSLSTVRGRLDIEFIASQLQIGDEEIIHCVIHDISKRVLAEEALQVANAELETQVADLRELHEMSTGLTGTLELHSVLQEVLRAALAVQGTSMGLLSLSHPQFEGLSVQAHSGFDDEFLKVIEWVPMGAGACGTCFQRRTRIIVEDVELEPIFVSYREAARAAGFRACHSTPLITRDGEIIGVLSAHFKQPHRPSERHIRLMDLYARMAADIIDNARLHQQVQRELEERQQALAREQEARANAESANRLKDEFLATVSHELRTPLNAITGWAHLVRGGAVDDATLNSALEIIERNSKVLGALVEDILDMSRIITGKLRLEVEQVDLPGVITAAVTSLQLAASSKHIDLQVELDSGASHLQGDANRLQQIVWNLLSNAIKFSADGGKVTVVTERLGSTVSIQVIDTGSGIAAEFLPFVFDRFRQADGSSTRQHGGLGLGLAIVRHLVELHGGTIYANSAGLGQGATFTVELPIGGAAGEGTPLDGNDESNQANPSAAPAVGANLPLSGANILIVDDEPDCRELVATIVRMRGALSHTAASVAEAVHLLGQNRYSALICDLAMPFEDGYSFIDWLRKSETGTGFRLPAIVLTANAGVQDRTRALAAGFDEFVAKPVQPNDLVKIIVELLGAASNFPSLAECTE